MNFWEKIGRRLDANKSMADSLGETQYRMAMDALNRVRMGETSYFHEIAKLIIERDTLLEEIIEFKKDGATAKELDYNGVHWVDCGGVNVGMQSLPVDRRLKHKDEGRWVAEKAKLLQEIARLKRTKA